MFMVLLHWCLQVNQKLDKEDIKVTAADNTQKLKQIAEAWFTTTKKIHFLPKYHD